MRIAMGHWPRQAIVVGILFCIQGALATAYAVGPSAPSVSFTPDQSLSGRDVYAAQCARCHGNELDGIPGPALKGARFAAAWLNGQRVLGDLYRRIHDTMPLNAPGSLNDADNASVIAFLLAQNGFAPGQRPLSTAMAAMPLQRPANSEPVVEFAKIPPKLPAPPVSVASPSTGGPDDAELAQPGDSSWLTYNKTLEGRRFSALDQINVGNAAQLSPRCIFQAGEAGAFQASPVVYEKIAYVTTAFGTYAFDAATCVRFWSHHYPPENKAPVLNSRGVAIYRGRVFRATPNGHLLALDAKTGTLLWDAWVTDANAGYWLGAAPVAYDGKVFIGEAGADFGMDGHIYAFDAENGAPLWTFSVIPTGKELGADSWKAGAEHGGGSLWSTITLDPAKHQLYVPVGNPAPDLNGAVRPGDNLFTNSVVVLDDRTGKLVWYVQQVPHDVHDSDTAAAPVIYELDGRKYMAVANKGGWLYIYDAATHKLLSRTEVSPHENVDAPITPQGTHSCPGINGGVEWNGPAYSPKARLLFVNSVHWCSIARKSDDPFVQDSMYFGGDYIFDPMADARGFTRAIDAATGKELWSRLSPTPMLAGLTPTAGDVVFTGDLSGSFLALEARTGKVLYSFNTGGSLVGGVSTYEVDGQQYVAVASGNNSRLWPTIGAPTVVIFSLPGR